MTWFKVDDKLHSHKKAARAGVSAMGLWAIAGSWSADHLTDGFVPDYIAHRLAPGQADDLAARLVAADLWTSDEHDGDKGWRFNDWDDYQPTRDAVEEKRAEWRERKRKQRRDDEGQFTDSNMESEGESRGDNDMSRRDTHRDSHGESHRPVPTRPVPTRPNPPPPTAEDRETKSEVGTAVDVIRHGLPDDAATDRKTLESAVRPLIERGWPPDQLAQRLLTMKSLENIHSFDAVLSKRCQDLAEERSPAEVREDANRDYEQTRQMLDSWKADEDKAWGDLEGAV